MSGNALNIGCLLLGGPEYKIQIGANTYRFEMHSYCGPMPINKDGSEKELGPTHKFWTIVSLWSKQGERVKDGWAIWEYPKPDDPTVYQLTEIKRCECGEQMYRSDKKEEWRCWSCMPVRQPKKKEKQ